MTDPRTPGEILREAEQEGYGLVASLREGDEYFDTLAKKWVTVIRVQEVIQKKWPGWTDQDRVAVIRGTDEEGVVRSWNRPLWNLYPVRYTDEHFAELFADDIAAQEQSWW